MYRVDRDEPSILRETGEKNATETDESNEYNLRASCRVGLIDRLVPWPTSLSAPGEREKGARSFGRSLS